MSALSGMKQIGQYMGKSDATMLKLIREYDFPAKMVLGCWESETSLIEEWRKNIIAGTRPQAEPQQKQGRLSTRNKPCQAKKAAI